MNVPDADIIEAAKLYDREKLLQLIKAKANLNARDDDNRTALMWAVINGYIDIVEDLIQAGANVNIRSHSGKTALDYAIAGNKKFASSSGGPFLAIIRMLEEAGAKKSGPIDQRTRQATEHRVATRKALYTIGLLAGAIVGIICLYKGYSFFINSNLPGSLIMFVFGVGALGFALKSWNAIQHSDPDAD